jgi:DNA gyrase subunit B
MEILTFREAVRKRPGMYVGDTSEGSGLHNLLWYVVDGCVGEQLGGRCDRVEIALHPGDVVTVADDGPGIPLDPGPDGTRFAERALTTREGSDLAIVNALCEFLELEVRRDGRRWTQSYARGVAQTSLVRGSAADDHGTRIRFRPDPQVFTTTELSYCRTRLRLRELVVLHAGLRCELRDERSRQTTIAGLCLADLLEHRRRAALCAPILASRAEEPAIELALEWHHGPTSVQGFLGTCQTSEGDHVDGLADGLEDVFRVVTSPPSHGVVRPALDGVNAVILIRTEKARLKGAQTKLRGEGVRQAVRGTVRQATLDAMTARPALADLLRSRLAR